MKQGKSMKTCFVCDRDCTDEKTWFSEPIDGYLCEKCKELPVVDSLETMAKSLADANSPDERVTELEQACEIAYALLNYTGPTIWKPNREYHRMVKARWEGAEATLGAVLGKKP